jgi:SAM-dependent methyltransferase
VTAREPSHPLFARIYDPVMALPERLLLGERREQLVAGLSGDVLDVGAGTGAMFPYLAERPVSVTAIEPDAEMRERAHDRAGPDVELVDARAETLPFPADSFDAVTAVFVFCTIPDVEAALEELARVLRPGGEFRFLEHVRGQGGVGLAHDVLAPGWHAAAGGCNLDRETGERFLADDRFIVRAYERSESGLSRALPLVQGTLQRRGDGLFG